MAYAHRTTIHDADSHLMELPDVLDPEGPGKADEDAISFQQKRAIAMHIQLTALRGLTYPIEGLRRDAPISATTYADWGRFRIEPGGGLKQMTLPHRRSPLDFALASAASPGGFAPQLLDRSEDVEEYERHGVGGGTAEAVGDLAVVTQLLTAEDERHEVGTPHLSHRGAVGHHLDGPVRARPEQDAGRQVGIDQVT